MSALSGLFRRGAARLRRGDASAVDAARATTGTLSERDRAALEERNNLSHLPNGAYGGTNPGAGFGGGH